jgi:hypothetical protein
MPRGDGAAADIPSAHRTGHPHLGAALALAGTREVVRLATRFGSHHLGLAGDVVA